MSQDEGRATRSRWKAVRDFVVEWYDLIAVVGVLILFVPAIVGQGVVRWIVWYPFWLCLGLLVVGMMRYTRRKARQDPLVNARVRWAMRTWGLRIALPGVVVAGVMCFAAILALPLLDDGQIRAMDASPATVLVIVGLALMVVGIGTFLLEFIIKDVRTDGKW